MSRTVLTVCPYVPPDGGGLERYVWQISTRLARAHGWRVVLATSGSHRYGDRVERRDGLTVHRLGHRAQVSSTPLDPAWSRMLRRVVAEERPEVVAAHAPVPGLADIAARVCGRLPFVLTYHSGSMRKGRHGADAAIWLYERLALPSMLRRSSAVICTSGFVQAFLRPAGPSVTITPGVDTAVFHRTGVRREPARLLYVGGFGRGQDGKGLPDVVQALGLLAGRHPSVHLHVAGDGDRAHASALALAVGVGDRVCFLGRRSPEELARDYRSAAVVLQPSRLQESFGMVLLEAMACGAPVVATAVGGVPDLVRDGRTGFVVAPGDAGALAERADRLLADPGTAARIGLAASASVTESDSWDVKAAATDRVLTRVLTAAPAPTP
jgi:glycosyltransferase involved in cell wall biosynthesis